jgi:hypothetical protein
MKIESLRIKNFRVFADETIRFDYTRVVRIVDQEIGANEFGKLKEAVSRKYGILVHDKENRPQERDKICVLAPASRSNSEMERTV